MLKKRFFLLFAILTIVILFWQCQSTPSYEKGSIEHIKAITLKIDDAVLHLLTFPQEKLLS